MEVSGPVGVKRMTIGLPNHVNAAPTSPDSNGRRMSRLVSIVARTGCYPLRDRQSCSWLDFLSRLLLSPKSLSSSSSLFPFTISRAQNKHCPYRGQRRAGLIARFINGGLSSVPQILGGSPGSASGSTFSGSLTTLGGGKNTVSRLFTLPFPLSFCANGFQHSEQISYSLPSNAYHSPLIFGLRSRETTKSCHQCDKMGAVFLAYSDKF